MYECYQVQTYFVYSYVCSSLDLVAAKNNQTIFFFFILRLTITLRVKRVSKRRHNFIIEMNSCLILNLQVTL